MKDMNQKNKSIMLAVILERELLACEDNSKVLNDLYESLEEYIESTEIADEVYKLLYNFDRNET